MRNHSRARRLALTALCAGTTLGAAGLAAVPTQALGATVACSDVWGSGSTLQTPAQQITFSQIAATDGAFANCTTTPSVHYNTLADGTTPYPGSGTGSGAALSEFALGSPVAITPGKSSNGAFLDSFGGSDAGPNAAALSAAKAATGSNVEVVPIMQAPVAVLVNLPSGCTISAIPTVTNVDLLKAWENNISWQTLLTDAKAKPTGTCNSPITLEARSDNSGTTYAFRQYLWQLDKHVSTNSVYSANQISTSSAEGESSGGGWPSTSNGSSLTVSPDENDNGGPGAGPNAGSGGVSNAVATNPGSMGYVNAADAHDDNGFTKWATGLTKFWVKVQNNGFSTTTVTGAQPETSTGAGNCYATYTGKLPTSTVAPDWSAVAVAKPTMASTAVYSLCTLTYDMAWHSYVSDATVAANYSGNYSGETPAGVEHATKDYLKWLIGTGTTKGQAHIPIGYSKLPSNIDSFATGTVTNQVGIN